MAKHTIATKSLSRFLQIFDGSFPSGAFVHSFGLEPHVILQKVRDIDELNEFLENLITYQYLGFEFAFVKKIYKYLEDEKLSLLIKQDNSYSAMQSYHFSKASKDLGQNYLRQIDFDITKPIVRSYFDSIKIAKSAGNELAVLSAYAFENDIEVEIFLLLWCKKNIINIAMTSLKISRIKPTQIQKMLFSFDENIEDFIQNSKEDINLFNPLFEEVIHQHKSLEPKLFVT